MNKKWFYYLCVSAFIIAGCSKEPLDNLTAEESRIYITNYDTSANFTEYKTFSLADSAAVIENNQLRKKERLGIDVQFIDAIAAKMMQMGFTRVAPNQNPDLAVNISRITNTSTQLVSYPSYGGYYNNYYDPFYYGYPGYSYNFPSYYGIYQSDETVLTIDMVDLKNATRNNELRGVWSGLIRGSGIFNVNNVGSQVDALFAQSPYLAN